MTNKSGFELNSLTVWSEKQADYVINALARNGYAVWAKHNPNADTISLEGYARIEYISQDAVLLQAKQPLENTCELVLRPAVDWFSMNMEEILRQNDHKHGWKNVSVSKLIDSAYKCADSLHTINKSRIKSENESEWCQRFVRKCVDVANYLMMAADNATDPIEQIPTPREEEHLPIG